ncbi:hypothetical protein EJB05_57841, partial [Eragrostis curvula]
MLSAMDMLGADADAGGVWAATSAVPRTGLPRHLYEVQAVTPLDGDRYVGCHKVPFPYRVYYCHMTAALSDRAYVVSLRSVGWGPAADIYVSILPPRHRQVEPGSPGVRGPAHPPGNASVPLHDICQSVSNKYGCNNKIYILKMREIKEHIVEYSKVSKYNNLYQHSEVINDTGQNVKK